MSFKEYDEKHYNNKYTREMIGRLNQNRAGIAFYMAGIYDAKEKEYYNNCYEVMRNAIRQLLELDEKLGA